MEVLLLILIVGFVALFVRVGGLSERVTFLEAALRTIHAGELREREVTLRAGAEAAPAPEDRPIQPAQPELTDSAYRRAQLLIDEHPWSGPGRQMPSRVESTQDAVVSGTPPTETGSPSEIPRIHRSSRRVEPEVLEPVAFTPEPPAAAPVGPGLVERAMLKLGLAPSDEGGRPTRAAIEAWLEGRMLAVVGGIALLLGAIFFLSLAFSRGWITIEMRVLIGLVTGSALLILGELAFSRLRGILGHVLVAVGLAVVSLALLAATRLYGIVPVEWGLAGAFVAAIAAAAIAIRHDSQLVAGFGLVAVLAAPPLLDASPTLVTLLFVAATLVGTTGVALFRTWIWLPPLAFGLAGPQLASYLTGDPPVGQALIATAAFWLVNVIAAGGEEARHASDRLRPTTVTLLLAAAAFTLWAGFTVLSGPQEQWRGSFVAALALMHLALGLFFLNRHGDRHPFGLAVSATGVAALTMAVPVQFGGPPVPIAWAAEAVALAWVAALRRHPYSAAISVLLGVLALGHLVAVEYPWTNVVAGIARIWPFVGPEGMTFAFIILALLVAGVAVPIGWVRAGLAVLGGFLTLYVLPFELSGTALVAGWATLAVVAAGLYWRVVAPRISPDFAERRVDALALPVQVREPVALAVAGLSRAVRPLLAGLAVVAGIGAIIHLGSIEYPTWDIVSGAASPVPFVGFHGLAFAIVLAMLAGAGLLVPVAWLRVGLTALGGLVTLYVFPFELSGPALVWAWAALATAAFAVEARFIQSRAASWFEGTGPLRLMRHGVTGVGALVSVTGLAHLLSLDFPIDRLGDRTLSTFPYAGPEGISLAAALAALAAVGWLGNVRWARLGAVGVGLALLAYTVAFEISPPAVTIAWGILAVAGVAAGRRIAHIELLPRTERPIRELVGERLPFAAAGLALLFLVVQSHWYAQIVTFDRLLGGDLGLTGTPFLAGGFLDDRTFAFVVLALTCLAVGFAWGRITASLAGGVAAALVIAWLMPFEIRPAYAIAAWSALGLVGMWVVRRVPTGRLLVGLPSIALGAFGAMVALASVAPPDRLVVDEITKVAGWPILTEATIALGALAVAVGVSALLHRAGPLSRWGFIAAGVIALYMLSVGVADVFQLQVGERPLEELQKEGQVGLSVLWSVLGGIGFATGLIIHRPPIRIAGLALLGLATTKVFLVDLAALDVAYRVLSLVALGVLLLVSAFAYARMQHPQPPTSPKPA